MPAITFFIDKKIIDEIDKIVEKKVFPDQQTFILTAIQFLIKVIKYCEENKIDLSECADKVIEFMLK